MARRLAVRQLGPFIFNRGGKPLSAKRVRPLFYEALEACGFETGRAGFVLYDVKKTAAGLLMPDRTGGDGLLRAQNALDVRQVHPEIGGSPPGDRADARSVPEEAARKKEASGGR
jgi:hypothetical protein